MSNHNSGLFRIAIITIICSLVSFSTMYGQRYKGQRFKVGAVLGMNMAQIDGDRMFGYNKFGVQAGVQGIAMLNKKQYLSLEFLLSQRGAVTSSNEIERIAMVNIRSNYIEAPILYNIKLPIAENSAGVYLYSGVSVARLLGARINGVNNPRLGNPILILSDRVSEFDTFELDYIIGGNYFFNNNFGVTFRHTVGMTTFFQPSVADIDLELKPLRNYLLTIGGVFIID